MPHALWCCLLFFLSGCGVDYYLHLAKGQARIAWRSTPIPEVLASPATPPDAAEKLGQVPTLVQFARHRLGLQTGDSYRRYFDTGGEPVSWNVSACPPDSFDPHLWHFPLVGALPYKGFFSWERAVREREELLAQGLDVLMGPVAAYSTLGYFSDPVLSTMLEEEEDGLAELLLHELTHATIYPAGQAEYSESAATYVGQAGALLYLEERYGPDAELLRLARLRQEDGRRFNAFVKEVADSLNTLYALALPREEVLRKREAIFARAKERFRLRRGEFAASRYDGFLKWEVNNARLLSYLRYHRDLHLFAREWEAHRADPSQAVARFRECGEASDPWDCLGQHPD
ncbi:MAG: aminopeptidase [Candidatus Handelsmanbacteria bacterium]|nr:aminopeptidase [Candidatus Handelsmanbacteria bacterium]